MLGEGGTLELTDASVPWDWDRTTEHVYMFFGIRAGGGGTLELTDASVPWDWGRMTARTRVHVLRDTCWGRGNAGIN